MTLIVNYNISKTISFNLYLEQFTVAKYKIVIFEWNLLVDANERDSSLNLMLQPTLIAPHNCLVGAEWLGQIICKKRKRKYDKRYLPESFIHRPLIQL